MTDISLQEATTDQVIEELSKRCDALVFARVNSLTPNGQPATVVAQELFLSGIGLCERLKARLLQEAMS